ncbi:MULTISPECIES: CD3324 family protein [Cohnella]|uniref:Mor transcription activator family protein n=1 Tax=Cohnella phaseoli TaxID=456490 RepID=A0A3D9ICK9_9BACL|nr:CD3324 family protein [Cohnella phaseoli]RED59411.1 Mor transcription activator family protein [Cohnella phaseoli]
MIYKNGRDVLPPSLLQELQNYVGGELIYIPKPNECRARWGEVSGTRKLLAERNKEIRRLHSDGMTVSELVGKYHLSGDSIRKIIVKTS